MDRAVANSIRFFVYAISSISLLSSAQSLGFNWALHYDGGRNYVLSTCNDQSSNIYSCGRFLGLVDFEAGAGTTTLNTAGGYEPFVCKHDAAGNLVWAIQFYGAPANTYDSWATSVVVDSSGGVLVAGSFTNTLDFDPGPGTHTLSPLNGSTFLCKLNTNGQLIWVKQYGNSINPAGAQIVIDHNHDILACGRLEGQGDFDPGPGTYLMSAPGFGDIYVLKLSGAGNFIWGKQITSAEKVPLAALAIDDKNNIYLSGGGLLDTIDLDPGAGTYTIGPQNGHSYICKWSSSGSFMSAVQIQAAYIQDLAIAQGRNIMVCGSFTGTADFDPGPGTNTVASNGSYDHFVVMLDSVFVFKWARAAGSTSLEGAYSLALDTSGSCYVFGTIQGLVNFSSVTNPVFLNSHGGIDACILKYSPAGNLVFARQIGGPGFQSAGNVLALGVDDIVVAGYFNQVTDFDPGPFTYTLASPAQLHQAFLARYLRCSPPSAPLVATNSYSICTPSSITVIATATGTIHWKDDALSNTYLASGNAYSTMINSPGTYYFIPLLLNQCSESLANPTITVFALQPPTITVSGPDTAVCAGSDVYLSASGAISYSWSTGPTGPGIIINPLLSGTSIVTGTGINGCTTTASHFVMVDPCLSVMEVGLNSLCLYPNPVSSAMTVESNIAGTFQLIDALGRIVFQNHLDGTTITKIDATDFPAGLYFVRLKTPTGEISAQSKVIKN